MQFFAVEWTDWSFCTNWSCFDKSFSIWPSFYYGIFFIKASNIWDV